MDDIKEALKYIAEKGNIFVIVQFAVNQFGYSNSGLSAKKLISDALDCEYTDAAGLNCGVGPGHMYGIFEKLGINTEKYLTALPNAGYPQSVSNRMVFAADNSEYFSVKASDMAERGINIVGGCCGTTPEYIAKLENAVKNMHPVKHFNEEHEKKIMFKPIDKSFYKDKSGKKLIAVELAPPVDSDDEKLMDAAHILKKSGVDVLTFPDSPSGRTRADSILMAEKVHKETGMTVMPHICCRDKNAIAMRSQLLGAHLNDINNFLVITGDPIPSMVRQSVKAVFNFDSVGLMNIIKDMNIKDKLRLCICLTTSDWTNILYSKTEMYEKFDTMLKEVDEEYRNTLINFAKYKMVMFIMAKIMEMETTEQNKVALYLFNIMN